MDMARLEEEEQIWKKHMKTIYLCSRCKIAAIVLSFMMKKQQQQEATYPHGINPQKFI